MSRIDEISLGLFIIGFAICIAFSGTAQAWDDEEGVYWEGEFVEVEWSTEPVYTQYKSTDQPNWYDPLIKLWITITAFFTHDQEIQVNVTSTCMKWDGSNYVPDTDTLPAEFGMTLDNQANNTVVNAVTLDPVEEYFKQNPDALDNFTTVDDDPDKPDLINTTVTISGGGTDVDETGFTALTDDNIEGLNEKLLNPDYGFALDGRGAGGGSGSIYEGIDLYGSGAGDESGMSAGFGWIFYGLIPIIFLFAVFKMCQRVLWGGE